MYKKILVLSTFCCAFYSISAENDHMQLIPLNDKSAQSIQYPVLTAVSSGAKPGLLQRSDNTNVYQSSLGLVKNNKMGALGYVKSLFGYFTPAIYRRYQLKKEINFINNKLMPDVLFDDEADRYALIKPSLAFIQVNMGSNDLLSDQELSKSAIAMYDFLSDFSSRWKRDQYMGWGHKVKEHEGENPLVYLDNFLNNLKAFFTNVPEWHSHPQKIVQQETVARIQQETRGQAIKQKQLEDDRLEQERLAQEKKVLLERQGKERAIRQSRIEQEQLKQDQLKQEEKERIDQEKRERARQEKGLEQEWLEKQRLKEEEERRQGEEINKWRAHERAHMQEKAISISNALDGFGKKSISEDYAIIRQDLASMIDTMDRISQYERYMWTLAIDAAYESVCKVYISLVDIYQSWVNQKYEKESKVSDDDERSIKEFNDQLNSLRLWLNEFYGYESVRLGIEAKIKSKMTLEQSRKEVEKARKRLQKPNKKNKSQNGRTVWW